MKDYEDSCIFLFCRISNVSMLIIWQSQIHQYQPAFEKLSFVIIAFLKRMIRKILKEKNILKLHFCIYFEFVA